MFSPIWPGATSFSSWWAAKAAFGGQRSDRCKRWKCLGAHFLILENVYSFLNNLCNVTSLVFRNFPQCSYPITLSVHQCLPQTVQVQILHRLHLGALQKQNLEASIPTYVKGGNVWGNTYFDWKMLNHVNYPRKNHTPFDSRWVTTKTSQNWPGAVPDRPHHLGLQKQDFKACIETRVKVWRLERAT